jgi:Spy/CpxP family protein refolding chaperone
MCHSRWAQRAARFRHFHQSGHEEEAFRGWEGDSPMGFGRGFDRGFNGGEQFGVRRPLRFLAHKLELDDQQIAELARILDELKIERAQIEVDDRRSLSEFADALGGENFDTAKATSGGERRVASAQRLRETLVRSLQQIHAMLRPDQRSKLAYLIRAGVLAL